MIQKLKNWWYFLPDETKEALQECYSFLIAFICFFGFMILVMVGCYTMYLIEK